MIEAQDTLSDLNSEFLPETSELHEKLQKFGEIMDAVEENVAEYRKFLNSCVLEIVTGMRGSEEFVLTREKDIMGVYYDPDEFAIFQNIIQNSFSSLSVGLWTDDIRNDNGRFLRGAIWNREWINNGLTHLSCFHDEKGIPFLKESLHVGEWLKSIEKENWRTAQWIFGMLNGYPQSVIEDYVKFHEDINLYPLTNVFDVNDDSRFAYRRFTDEVFQKMEEIGEFYRLPEVQSLIGKMSKKLEDPIRNKEDIFQVWQGIRNVFNDYFVRLVKQIRKR